MRSYWTSKQTRAYRGQVSNGILWLDDIQQFYRERSAIEKEYSSKLNALAQKYFEKKARKSSSLSVGDTPSMTRDRSKGTVVACGMGENFVTLSVTALYIVLR
jgi:hypothetical protein